MVVGAARRTSGTRCPRQLQQPRQHPHDADRVALIDWDEAHVYAPDLDQVLPDNAAGFDDGAHDIAAHASAALEAEWEAAVCW